VSFGSLLKSPLLLFCRLFWGISFMVHGWEKLMHISRTADSFNQLNIPYPLFQAYLVGSLEFIGGLLLAIGLASRLIAIPLAIIMITAYLTAHLEAVQGIFTNPNQFVKESPFNFLLAVLLVLAFGPGRFSIDYYLKRYYFR
jgi:putative oxidoreductase